MKLNSLAFRLFATAALCALVVLPIAGFIIDTVHKRDVKEAFDSRLSQLLTIIIAFSTDHPLVLAAVAMGAVALFVVAPGRPSRLFLLGGAGHQHRHGRHGA